MTATPPAESLSFYPRFLFSHSPTYNQWARLTAKDIHEGLHQRRGFEGQDVWFYTNHPIRWVRIVGIVVAYDDMEKMVCITVDDGSGYLMDLIAWKGKPPEGKKPKFSFDGLKNVSLHSIIKAKGSVGEFRGNKQLLLRRIEVLHDTNSEVDAWAETIKFKKNVLSKPWYLTEERRAAEAKAEEERKLEEERRSDERKLRKEKERRSDERKLRKEKELENALKKKKGKREAVEENGKDNQAGVEDVATEVSYRGHRRLPGSEKQEPLPPEKELPAGHPTSQREETPQPSASESIYRGRRRRSPRPPPPPVSPDLKPAEYSAPTLTEATCPSELQLLQAYYSELGHGQEPDHKRRRYLSPALELELQPSSQRSETLESSFRGSRRSSRVPLQLTVSNVALLEHSTSSEFQTGDQSQPSSVKARSYVGRRRTGSSSASIITQSHHENHHPTSRAKLETVPPSPLPHSPEDVVVRKSRSTRYSPRRLRIPHNTYIPRDTSPSSPKPAFPNPTPEQVPEFPSSSSSTSIYRGRRRRAGSETPSSSLPIEPTVVKRAKLDQTVEPPLSALAECSAETNPYRGRRRRQQLCGEEATAGPQPNLPRSRESSVFSNPVVQETGGYRHRREGASTLPEESVLSLSLPISSSRDGDGDADGSSYRGRRRMKVS